MYCPETKGVESKQYSIKEITIIADYPELANAERG
jgi:hypothetical protein